MVRSAHVRLSSLRFARRTALGLLAPSLAAAVLAGCGGNDFQPSAANTGGSAGSESVGGEAAGGQGGQGGQAAGGEGNGGGGGEGGSPVVTPAGCIPSENDGEPVPADCGIFVDATSGSDDDDGSQATPVQSLAHAITLANGKPIYACASETAFEDPLEVLTHSVFFGGLDCEDWTYLGADAKTMIATTAGETDAPVTVSGPITVQFDTFHIEAPHAVQPGQSSIAMFVDGGFVDLVNVELVAGDGAHGVAGADGTPLATNVAPSGWGGSGIVGGNGGINGVCGKTGGKGGGGGYVSGGFGIMPGHGGAGDLGQGGPGGSGQIINPWSCNVGKGGNGTSGTVGTSGSVSPFTLTSQGFGGGDGSPGTQGTHGTSGGGAGGSAQSGGAAGQGGGGGGAGGCGGHPGLGGMAGGSSIALALVGAEVTVLDVVLRVGKGGNGGNGGAGRQGQAGGQGGLTGSCIGGSGGSGGAGGNGGGSHGGNALGIAAASSQVSGTPIFDTTQAQAGIPGQGGVNGGAPAGQGGVAGEVVLQKIY